MGSRLRRLAAGSTVSFLLAASAVVAVAPVIEIKPHLVEFGARGEVRQPAWSHELMAGDF